MTDLALQVSSLAAAIAKLPAKDQEFATSLCGQFNVKHSLSDKQAYWVGKLLERTHADEAAPKAIAGAPGAWEAFFKAVPAEAKRPAVILTLGNPEEPSGALKVEGKKGGTYLRLMFQPVAEGKAPKAGRWGYAGTLRPGGELRFATTATGGFNRAEATTALQMLAADTIGALKVTGRAFGICANCGRLLTHPASIAFGIGPVCSGYLGLGAEYASMVALVAAGGEG